MSWIVVTRENIRISTVPVKELSLFFSAEMTSNPNVAAVTGAPATAHAPTSTANPTTTNTPPTARARKKLVIVGDGACGKTSLLTTFSRGFFPAVCMVVVVVVVVVTSASSSRVRRTTCRRSLRTPW